MQLLQQDSVKTQAAAGHDQGQQLQLSECQGAGTNCRALVSMGVLMHLCSRCTQRCSSVYCLAGCTGSACVYGCLQVISCIVCTLVCCCCRHGFQLVVAVALGAVELMAVALIITNLHHDRAYPTFWW